jgi:hypothetical protein
MKSKKGVAALFAVLGMLIVLALMALVISSARNVASSEIVTRERITQDLHQIINLLVSTEGETTIKYPVSSRTNISSYTFSLQHDKITVYVTEDRDLQSSKMFHLPEGYVASGAVQSKASFCVTKKDTTILLGVCRP